MCKYKIILFNICFYIKVDLKSFEFLFWEIECIFGFKKVINSRYVFVYIKKRVFECIKKLVEGYRELYFCKVFYYNGN